MLRNLRRFSPIFRQALQARRSEKDQDDIRVARERLRENEREQIRQIIEKKDTGFSTWRDTFNASKDRISNLMFYGFSAYIFYLVTSTVEYGKDEVDGNYRLRARKRKLIMKSMHLHSLIKIDMSDMLLDHSEGNLSTVCESLLYSVSSA